MGIRARADTLAELFAQTALGMMHIVTDAPVAARDSVEVACAAAEPDLLLVDWLNALVFEMATRRMLFGVFEVHIEERAGQYQLAARARGEPVDVARHQPAVEVKGATFTALDVHQCEDGDWFAQCVVDV